MLSALSGTATMAEDHVSVIYYSEADQLLSINIVSPSTNAYKLYVNSNGILSELTRFTKIGDHNILIHLPCTDFNYGDQLYVRANDVTLSLTLDSIVCSNVTRTKQPKLIYQESKCLIQPNGTTLWRVADLLSMKNGYSIHQNLYAVFFNNRESFTYEDIFKMNDDIMVCPTEELIASIDKDQALEMYRAAQDFQLTKNNTTDTDSSARPSDKTIDLSIYKSNEEVNSAINHNDNKLKEQSTMNPPSHQSFNEFDSSVISANERSSKAPSSQSKAPKTQPALNKEGRVLVNEENNICYILPQGKTLWRVGLALSELNGYSIHQNMYAVYKANPSAFPTDDFSYMLDRKLTCPTSSMISNVSPAHAKKILLPSLK